MLYAVPAAWSAAAAHAGLLRDVLFLADDRSPTTRAALAFVQADFAAIGLAVLYWMAVEAGWRVALASLLVGAGLCVAWVSMEGEMAGGHLEMLAQSGTLREHLGTIKDD